MHKEVVRSPRVPETGGPFSLAVRYGDMVYVSGLPPFEEDFCARLREARSKGEPLPKYERRPIEVETRIVMNHMQWLLQAAGTTMAKLLKEIGRAARREECVSTCRSRGSTYH